MMQVNVRPRTIVLAAACSLCGCSLDSREVGLAASGGDAGARAGERGGAGGASGASAAAAGGGGLGGDASSPSGGSSGTSASTGGSSDLPDSGAPDARGNGTWCNTQSPSAGVLAADFQCLDFETEVPAEVWASEVTGAATVATTAERAFSPTSSWRSSVPAAEAFADRTVATLEWANVGAQAVSSVRVAMQVNPQALSNLAPAWTGSITLVCVAFGSGEACLHYTRSEPALFLRWVFTGGPASAAGCEVSGSLQPELWNALELSVASDGIQVFVDGVAASTDCVGTFGVGTVASVTVGLQSNAATTQDWTVYFDDIVAETQR